MAEAGDPAVRAHELSPEAVAYKARRTPSVPLAMPELSDFDAVGRWRSETNAVWGESDDPNVPHERITIAGVDCLMAGPSHESADAHNAPTVVYAHGGGYVLGSAAVAIPITARLGRTLRIVSVDYRQPPAHPYPAALNDVLAVCRELAADGAPLALAGDSAGGALALSASVNAVADGIALSAVVLFSPLLDHVPAHGAHSADSTTHDDETGRLLRCYVGGADPADPGISPLRARLAGLPRVLVQAAADEQLARQAREFAERAEVAGVEIVLDLWPGMWHTWHYHALPEANQALAEAVVFLARRS